MNKKTVLEMFKDIKEVETADDPKIAVEDLLPFFCEKVEQALLELKAIKEANPSDALKGLKQIEDVIETKIGLGVVNTYITNIIKQSLLKSQEQDKVLEIIKEKEVDVKLFFNALFREQQYKINSLEFYNGSVGYKRLWLNQEEFDLLKRWIECQKN